MNDVSAPFRDWLAAVTPAGAFVNLLDSFAGELYCLRDAGGQVLYWSEAATDLLGNGQQAGECFASQTVLAGCSSQSHPWFNAQGEPIGTLERWYPENTPVKPNLAGFARDRIESFHGIITCDLAMKQALQIVKNVAETEATILIRGESGTGKELIAKALHQESHRRDGPFLAINCAALSPNLLESELFGHVKGAFTGAIKDRPGLFKRADGGTIFLDEVAEMPLELQAKLLRVLQERVFNPVGGDRPVQVDVRIIAATHRSLREEVKAGRFREDLMYRLRVVPVFLPALRERRQDIGLLLGHFIEKHNQKGLRRILSVNPHALQVLLDYPWPGNVRELQNVVEYAFAVGREEELSLANLPPEFREPRAFHLAPQDEAEAIHEALRLSEGRIDDAARHLGMSRATFWRYRKRLGI